MELRGEMSIDITVPSCSCCSTKMEQELSTVLGIPEGAMRLVVPVRAQLYYDPHVVNLSMVVDGLRAKGCGVVTERTVFRIPARPAVPPPVWKEKIKRVSDNVQGIISASVSFQTSRITVDYFPGLISLKEIRETVIGWSASDSRSKTKMNDDKTTNAMPPFDITVRRAA